jgi:hypothetical protein
MSKLRLAGVLILTGFAVAQTSKAPDAYSATVVNAMFGSPVAMQVQRDGPRATVEQVTGSGNHIRTFYDLEKHLTYTVTLNHPEVPCGASRFSGDWGDPFETSASLMQDIGKANPKATGSETVNGFASKVMEADVQGAGKVKVWIDNQYGMVVKAQVGTLTIIEVKQLKVGKPPAAALVLPAACASAPPPPPTEAERIAAETGGDVGDFVNAISAAPSPNSCSVVFRVVKAGTMQPVAPGFQLAIDTSIDPDHMPAYSTGISTAGHATYSGGALREVTAQMRNGAYRLDNAPAHFYAQANFGTAGEASAVIHRACVGPQTVLLLVVKNPAKLGEGADWLWVKSGKFAGGD